MQSPMGLFKDKYSHESHATFDLIKEKVPDLAIWAPCSPEAQTIPPAVCMLAGLVTR